MTITPEQAKTLNCDDYPRPWEIGQVPVFDPWDDYEESWYAGPAIVYDEDIAPLVAAAPVMAEQIAGMTYEYAPLVCMDGEWFYCTGLIDEDGIDTTTIAAHADWSESRCVAEKWFDATSDEVCIVRRLVSKPEEIS